MAIRAAVVARGVVVPVLLGLAILPRRSVGADRADDAEHDARGRSITARIGITRVGIGRRHQPRGERNRRRRRGSNGMITDVTHGFALSFVSPSTEVGASTVQIGTWSCE